jgi:RimJ/RimL family protein N-acetyltransferase
MITPQYGYLSACLLDDAQLQQLQMVIEQAYRDPMIGGDWLRERLANLDPVMVITTQPIHPVGFFIPRRENGYWRSGTVYLDPKYRGRGIMCQILKPFFDSHMPAVAWIADANAASQSLYTRLGFTQWRAYTVTNRDGTLKPGAWYLKETIAPPPTHHLW